MAYELLDHVELYRGPIFKLAKDRVRFQSGAAVSIDVIEHRGGAAVVALNEQQEVVLVNQYRHPMNQFVLELPAGKLEEQDQPESAAQRELAEEAGLIANNWQLLNVIYPAPGYCSEKVYIYLATDLQSVARQPDFDEEIEVVYLPLSTACARVQAGEICDAKTIIGLLAAERLVLATRTGSAT